MAADKPSKEVTYRELHIPAASLVQFMQSIHSQQRVGTLTVNFSTGGVPSGMLVWREKLLTTPTPADPSCRVYADALTTT